jgi:putative transposase
MGCPNPTHMVRVKEIRLKKYDYKANGYYFVTAVCHLRQNLLQDNESLVEKELRDLQTKIPGVKLDYFTIMPNHIHIILILENSLLSLGEIVRRFKAKVTHSLGKSIWQPNYYEHVIRNESVLEKIRQYIINNPAEFLLDFDQFYNSR